MRVSTDIARAGAGAIVQLILIVTVAVTQFDHVFVIYIIIHPCITFRNDRRFLDLPGLRKKDSCLLTGMGGFNLTVALGTFTDLLVVFFDRLVDRIRCRIAAAKQKGCA